MKRILWLTSWYPNLREPFEGDFIQRHARAVASHIPVTVIHVTQYGEKTNTFTDQTDVRDEGNLREIIVYFKFKKTGLNLLDKILYNRKFYSVYRKLIRSLLKKDEYAHLIHLHIPMKAGIIAGWMKKKWSVPYIISEQASTYKSVAADSFEKRNFYYKNAVKRIFQRADIITNVSFTVGEQLKRIFNLEEIAVVPNVVDTNYFNYSPQDNKKFRFIHVSSLNDQKNPIGIINAFKKISSYRSDWELVLVGPIAPALAHIVRELNLADFIQYTGEIQYHEVAIQLQRSSAFVLFSRHENLPCVLLEALCCGLPVVATDVGGVRDVVKTTNGFLIESENENQLVAALDQMIDNYHLFNRGEIARDAQSRFNYETVGKQFVDLYESLLKVNLKTDAGKQVH